MKLFDVVSGHWGRGGTERDQRGRWLGSLWVGHRDLIVATILLKTLEKLNIEAPKPRTNLEGIKIK